MIKNYVLDQPAVYRIRVYGHLDARWSERMGDMRIRHPEHLVDQTVLTGELIDQAELFGVLNSLYTLGLFLLHVEHVDLGTTTDAGGVVVP
jgi:hypothetical protein